MLTSLFPITRRAKTEPSHRGADFCVRAIGSIKHVLFAVAALILALPAQAGFFVENGILFDNNGNPFIMRGISFPHTWFQQNTTAGIPAVAATGANCVRLVLSNGRQWAANSQTDVANLLALCKANKLIAIPEVHDCTGWPENQAAAPLSTAVDYWISIQDVLKGQENFVIINIANEAFGNNVPAATYVSQYIDAITRLRAAGFTHTLMVDGANWGQEWQDGGIMKANAARLMAADPLHNLVFSVHMYEVYQQDSVIEGYMNAFDVANLPLVVGEFAANHTGGVDVNEGSIMMRAQQHMFGYMGWSWSGNGGGLSALDMVVNFNPAQRTPWGNTLISGANGIAATSKICTVFNTSTTPSLTVSPTTLSFTSTAGSSPVAVTSNVTWSAASSQTFITVTPASGSNNGVVSVAVSANTGATARTGTVTLTGGGITRTISVTQAAASANSLTVTPATLSFTSTAGSSPVTVASNVAWTATSSQTFITVTPASGTGNGTAAVSVTANTGATARTGTVTFTGGGITRTVSVTQAAAGSNNTLTVTPAALSFTAGAGSSTFAIASNGSWTVSDDQTWITTTPTTGTSNANVAVSVTANTGATARTGTITVTGGGITRTVSVTQAAGTSVTPCSNGVAITVPFTKDGAGEFCYVTSGSVNFINSWNMQLVEVNGVPFTNIFVSGGNLPARINGNYYIHYVGQFPWSHLEVK